MATYLQGRFRPLNPKKYRGDINKIVFRSSLELVAFKFCDTNPAIVYWGSEECIIPYKSPVDNRAHRYFMDLKVWTRKEGQEHLQVTLIEIKPRDQIKEPKRGTKKEKTFINEMQTWLVNSAKWQAARDLCEKEGWKFVIWTEDHLVPGQDPEVRKRFQIKSQKKRESEAQDRLRAARVQAMKKNIDAQVKATMVEVKKDSLLP